MKRTLGSVAFGLWAAVLVLAAWPGLVRPAFLDGANSGAVSTLRLFGMSAGQPLFQTDESAWKQHGFCFFLRDRDAAAGELVFPPEGECRLRGFFPRLPPVSRATHRMLAAAWRSRGDPGRSEPFLEHLGGAFCRAAEDPPEILDGAWIWYYENYHTGELLRRNGLRFEYACGAEQLGRVIWTPADAELLAHWKGTPW